ncbi:hypothetical protein Tco_1218153, partial [Tanacetum coccineum]
MQTGEDSAGTDRVELSARRHLSRKGFLSKLNNNSRRIAEGAQFDSDTSSDSDLDVEPQNLHKFVSLLESEKLPLTVESTETVSQDHDSVERDQSNCNMEISQGTSPLAMATSAAFSGFFLLFPLPSDSSRY